MIPFQSEYFLPNIVPTTLRFKGRSIHCAARARLLVARPERGMPQPAFLHIIT